MSSLSALTNLCLGLKLYAYPLAKFLGSEAAYTAFDQRRLLNIIACIWAHFATALNINGTNLKQPKALQIELI